jgi:hypothetical protein
MAFLPSSKLKNLLVAGSIDEAVGRPQVDETKRNRED